MAELVRYDTMRRAIVECHAVDEVKDIRDKAMALEAYAKVAMDTDSERKALEIRLRAERRVGQLLAEKERSNGVRMNGKDKSGNVRTVHDEPSEYQQAKSDAGISDTQAKRWQNLASVPHEEFEEALANPVVRPSTTGIVKRQKPEPKEIDPNDEHALWVWGRLRDFEREGVLSSPPGDVFKQMTHAMQSDVQRLVPAVVSWMSLLGDPDEQSDREQAS